MAALGSSGMTRPSRRAAVGHRVLSPTGAKIAPDATAAGSVLMPADYPSP